MPRLSPFAVALVLSCKGATPAPPAVDGSAALWPRDDAAGKADACGESHPVPFERRPADVLLVFDRLGDELFCIAPLWADAAGAVDPVADAADRIDEVLRRMALAAPAAPRAGSSSA